MIRRWISALRRLLVRWLYPRELPDIEAYSEPGIILEARPRRIVESLPGEEGIIETSSEPAITLELRSR